MTFEGRHVGHYAVKQDVNPTTMSGETSLERKNDLPVGRPINSRSLEER